VGTNGADLLVGTPGDDVIVGLGGRDVIVGKNGNDLLCGGRGGDLSRGTTVTILSLATMTSSWPWPSRGFPPVTGATSCSATTAPTSLSDCPAATSSTAGAATTW
jgi:Ca2+-binding RTX toxin-like protein